MTKLLMLVMVSMNVMYITDESTVQVGEVIKRSGSVTYVKPCGSSSILKKQIRTSDGIPVKMTCREFLEMRGRS